MSTERENFEKWCIAPRESVFYSAAWEAWQARARLGGVTDERITAIFQKYGTGRADGFAAAARAVLAAAQETT